MESKYRVKYYDSRLSFPNQSTKIKTDNIESWKRAFELKHRPYVKVLEYYVER